MPGNFRPVQCHFVLRSDLSCQLQAVGNFIAAQNSMAKNTPAASFILSMLGAENSGESVGIFVKSVKVFSLKLERERRVSSGG